MKIYRTYTCSESSGTRLSGTVKGIIQDKLATLPVQVSCKLQMVRIEDEKGMTHNVLIRADEV